jgi:hypothetical protein
MRKEDLPDWGISIDCERRACAHIVELIPL